MRLKLPLPAVLRRALGMRMVRDTLVVGLDVGATTTKLAFTQHEPERPPVIRLLALVDTPFRPDGTLEWDHLADFIDGYCAEYGLPMPAGVVAALPHDGAGVTRDTLVQGPADVMASHAREKAVQVLPIEPEEGAYRYVTLAQVEEGVSAPALLVAARTHEIRELREAMERLPGTSVLDLQPFALFNLYSLIAPEPQTGATLLHIGATDGVVVVVDEQGAPSVIRPNITGSRVLIDSLTMIDGTTPWEQHLRDKKGATKTGQAKQKMDEWLRGVTSVLDMAWSVAGLMPGSRVRQRVFVSGGAFLFSDVIDGLRRRQLFKDAQLQYLDLCDAFQLTGAQLATPLTPGLAPLLCPVAVGLSMRVDAVVGRGATGRVA